MSRLVKETPSLRGVRLAILAGILSFGAGLYMLTQQAAASNSIFNPLLHGIGVYFIARGIWMCVAAGRRSDELELLGRIAYAAEVQAGFDEDGEEKKDE